MLGPLTRQCLAHLLLLLRPKGLIYMTAKDELRQALLNTCSISDEALTLLNGILDGSGGGGGAFVVHCQLTYANGDWQATLVESISDIVNAITSNQNIIFMYSKSYDETPSTEYSNYAPLTVYYVGDTPADINIQWQTVPWVDVTSTNIMYSQELFDYYDGEMHYINTYASWKP